MSCYIVSQEYFNLAPTVYTFCLLIKTAEKLKNDVKAIVTRGENTRKLIESVSLIIRLLMFVCKSGDLQHNCYV